VGFFKKVSLADYLAKYVDQVYETPGQFQAPALVLATVSFAWQIYFDFSGYTDMARGIARLMGFRMMLNFNNPYVATGLGDFWSRWHISLSTWFKDYLYFPLGGNRGGTLFTYRNMFITMVISGIWHGAEWRFFIWGVLHAVGRILTRELERSTFYRDHVPTLVKQFLVFAFVCFTWIFFRAKSRDDAKSRDEDWLGLDNAWQVISRIFSTGWADPQFPLLMAVLVLAVCAYQFLFTQSAFTRRLLETGLVRVGLAVAMIIYLVIVAQPSTKAFIYFQF